MTQKSIQGVLFDMDGLILDTEKWLQIFYRKAANDLGFTVNPEYILSIRSLPAPLAEKKMKQLVGEDFDFMAVRELRKQYMNEHIAKNGVEKKKGIDELLQYIHQNNLKCAVATATAIPVAKDYLAQAGVLHYFDKIVSASMVKNGKPQPDIYIETARQLNLSPEHCMALEDSPNGVISAYRAGCVTVMVPDLTQPDEELSKIIYAKADDLNAVIPLIEKFNYTERLKIK